MRDAGVDRQTRLYGKTVHSFTDQGAANATFQTRYATMPRRMRATRL